mmetsp:Transcript_65967/g.141171  ORF Transcript_65967/g.141171 Transcript_65967/m.141171 type:complete len:263 (-) Transcript_65967:1241-2029(-)
MRIVLAEDLWVLVVELVQTTAERHLEEEIDKLLILVGFVKVDHERAVHHGEKVALPANLPYRSASLDKALGDALQRIALASEGVFSEENCSEAAPPQHADAPKLRETSDLLPIGGRALPLLPLVVLDVAIHAGQEIAVPIFKGGLQQHPDGLPIEGEARHAHRARSAGHLGGVIATEQGALPKVARAMHFRHLVFHHTSIGVHALLGHDATAGVNDVPHFRFTHLPLLQHALPRTKAEDPHSIASELPTLRAQERGQCLHLV